MSSNIEEVSKAIEEFSSDFLELSKLQKLMLEYITSIKEQKNEIDARYNDNISSIKKLSNSIEEKFQYNLDREIKKIEEETEKQYQKLENILAKYSKDNDLSEEIAEINKINLKYRDYIENASERVKEINDIIENQIKNSIVSLEIRIKEQNEKLEEHYLLNIEENKKTQQYYRNSLVMTFVSFLVIALLLVLFVIFAK